MEDSKGLFIALEGVPGSGRSTQLKLLTDKLQKDGWGVVVFDFPDYQQPSSFFIREYLDGSYGKDEAVSPYTVSLFYALDRYHAAVKIRQALADGMVVLAKQYTGSNMALQGSHFAHPEERRGFFIWLDNLEYQTLKIPRPDKSLILRLPPEPSSGETGQSRQQAGAVYDDLAQLFPKDFMRLDCVRGNKLLSAAQVHDMIWNTIQPLLPPKSETRPATVTTATQPTEEPVVTEPPKNGRTIKIQGFSNLLAAGLAGANIELTDLPNTSAHQKVQPYFLPKNLDDLTKTKYETVMNNLFEIHAEISEKLTDYLTKQAHQPNDAPKPAAHHAQATQWANAVLPLATKLAVTIPATHQAVYDMVERLRAVHSPEALDSAERILSEAHKAIPSLAEPKDQAKMPGTKQQLKELTSKYLPETHGNGHDPVSLQSAWPRNELALVPHMVYEHSSLSLAEIEQEVSAWNIDRKIQVFEAYMNNRPKAPSALLQTSYTWDILHSYETLQNLERQGFANIQWQEPTPRFGYEVPQIIEDADLLAQFEKCFDLSAQLYSTLQAEGYIHEAQYATLFGHRTRWKMTLNAQDIFDLASSPTSPKQRELVGYVTQKLAEVHPMLAEAIAG